MATELFLIHTGFLGDEEIFAHRLKRVSEERRSRVEACKGKNDRLRSLAGGLLVEELLRQNFYSPDSVVRDEKGKLVIPGQDSFYFNLSHSGEYAACVISEYPVGVDIQQYRPVKEGLAKRFFQADEVSHIKQAKGSAREELFFRYWSGKESYVKLTGEGLHQNLNSFKIDLEAGTIEDKKEPERRIYLKEYRCLPRYTISAASYENSFSRFVKKIYYRL